MLLLSAIMTCESRAQNPDTVLHSGVIAPFTGVLVDIPVYKSFSIDQMKAKDFEENLDSYITCEGLVPADQITLFSFNGMAVVAVVGLAGIITGVIIGMNH